ncbi:flippase [Stutzerimonas stutzeri]|uniref:flippase n=1 Tax=Stutzerimonas stutzeri TaxID=316 RepID=UPI00163AE9D0|nr:flippase [Stutzerimonas stutzeri]MDH1553387.1 flippase [Stutzerimonas stutzeri]
MILRNSLLNFLSLALPLLVGLFSVPPIIAALGTERFGALTLAWAITGYVSVFDLGIGRALTKRVAELGGRLARIRSIVRLGLALLFVLGVLMAGLVLLLASLLDHQGLGLEQDEYARSLLLMAASVPLVILGSGLRGALEGMHRFGMVSLGRLLFGLTTFAGPLLVLESAPRLDAILAIMLQGRLIGSLIMGWACRQYLARGDLSLRKYRVEAGRMLRFGGWLTVSNLVSALMLYLDRFLIASSPHAPLLAYYTTPYEFVTKLFILPSALSGVLFPHMSRNVQEGTSSVRLLFMGSGSVLLFVTPAVTTLVLFAEPLLGFWISPAFAEQAAPVLRTLAAGVLLNSLAQIFQTCLLSHGKARWMARLHMLECLLYLPLLFIALQRFGILGAAWVWTLRVVADALFMAWKLNALQPTPRHPGWALAIGALAVFPLLPLPPIGLVLKAVLWGLSVAGAVLAGGGLLYLSGRQPRGAASHA